MCAIHIVSLCQNGKQFEKSLIFYFVCVHTLHSTVQKIVALHYYVSNEPSDYLNHVAIFVLYLSKFVTKLCLFDRTFSMNEKKV